MRNHIELPNLQAFEIRQAKIFADMGYTFEVQQRTKTFRYANPIVHPVNGKVLMVVTPVTHWHLDGSFTKESPANIPGLMTAAEKSGMRNEAAWKALGYFPDL